AVGLHFHASADGMAAADAAFETLDLEAPTVGTPGGACPLLAGASIHLDSVSIATPDGVRWAPAGLSLTALPGEVTVLVGPNGEGKSTALLAVAALLPVDVGAVTARVAGASVDLAASDPDHWLSQVAWVPQRPDRSEE